MESWKMTEALTEASMAIRLKNVATIAATLTVTRKVQTGMITSSIVHKARIIICKKQQSTTIKKGYTARELCHNTSA